MAGKDKQGWFYEELFALEHYGQWRQRHFRGIRGQHLGNWHNVWNRMNLFDDHFELKPTESCHDSSFRDCCTETCQLDSLSPGWKSWRSVAILERRRTASSAMLSSSIVKLKNCVRSCCKNLPTKRRSNLPGLTKQQIVEMLTDERDSGTAFSAKKRRIRHPRSYDNKCEGRCFNCREFGLPEPPKWGSRRENRGEEWWTNKPWWFRIRIWIS